MGLRDRREEQRDERQEFGRRGSAVRYQMRQKLVSIGDDFWIEDDAGNRVYHVDGKALRIRNTLDFEDANGTKLCRIQTRALHIRDTMEIEDADGKGLATVHQALITPLRERWRIDLATGEEWKIQGSIAEHEYEIEADGRKIAEVSKKWFRVRDTYGVEISPGVDAPLVLAATVAIDSMTHPAK